MYKSIIIPLFATLSVVAASGDIVCSNQIVDFNVIDTSASPPIFTKLTRTVDLSDFPTCALNIEATIKKNPSNCNGQAAKCVKFFLDDVEVRRERFAPFTIYGNGDENFSARKPPLGIHTLKACTYSDGACTRNESGCKEMRVNFLDCGRPTVAPIDSCHGINRVTGFNLVDTESPYHPIISPFIPPNIDLAEFPACALNIYATVHENKCTPIKCVKLSLGDQVRQEVLRPYALYGNTGRFIRSGKPTLGAQTLKACTYTDDACTQGRSGCLEVEVFVKDCVGTNPPSRSPTFSTIDPFPIFDYPTHNPNSPKPGSQFPTSFPIPISIEPEASDYPSYVPTISFTGTEPPHCSDEPSLLPITSPIPTLVPTLDDDPPTDIPTTMPFVPPSTAPSLIPSPTPTITPPLDSPSIAPIPMNLTPTPVQIILVEDYYISFVAPGATREPTQLEYEEMLVRINAWFEAQFQAKYANRTDVQFLGIESSIDFTLYGINNTIPPRPADFNIYMNFDFSEYTYSETSVVPTTQEVFEIMRSSITRDFILQVVRTFTGTPFESTIEVFFAASQMVAPPYAAPMDIPVDMPVKVPVNIPSTAIPTAAPVRVHTEGPFLRIRVENFFLAYVAPKAIEPTEDQYALLVDVTNDFFADTFSKMFANDPTITFVRAESTLGLALFNASIPTTRFNIYTSYSFTDLIYTSNSTPPDAAASFVVLRDSLNTAYITKYVRSLTNTPFVTTNEVVFQSSTLAS